jgi:hypothetical protein
MGVNNHIFIAENRDFQLKMADFQPFKIQKA